MKTLSIVTVLAVLLAAVPFTGHAEEGPAPVSAHFEDADVMQVIRFLAEVAKANVIVSPKVDGKITLKLKEVPWRAALEQVAVSVGAVVVEEAHGILRVIPQAEAELERRQADRKAAETQIRALEEQVERARRRLAELEARAKAQAAEAEAARRKAKTLTQSDPPFVTDGRLLRFHDVKDLIALHPQLPARVQRLDPHAEVGLQEGVLVVKAAPAVQERVTQLLTEMRAAVAADPKAAIDRGVLILRDGRRSGAQRDDWRRTLKLAAARIQEAQALIDQAQEGRSGSSEQVKNLSESALEWQVFGEHLRKQIAERGDQGPTQEQRSAIGRYGEGAQRLLESIHAARLGGIDRGRVFGPDGKPQAGADVLVRRFVPGVGEVLVPSDGSGGQQAAKDGAERPPAIVFGDGKATRRAKLVGRGAGNKGHVVWILQDPQTGRKYSVANGKVVALDPDDDTFESGFDKLRVGGEVIYVPRIQGPTWFKMAEGKHEIVVEKDAEGRFVARAKSSKPLHVKVRKEAPTTRTKAAEDALAIEVLKRARDLEAAAQHLEAAGDAEGARELRRRAREAYAAAKRQPERPADEGSLLDAVNALRRDVNQLRGEVRELTGLVRQLLGQRRPPDRGGRGAAR